ncbi:MULTISPECIES: hypothetical protein [unclassified Sphingomonas]|uniref:hypothetical protein n=1 Tax=unclassified Sphingomonas TaxID=196159 RepID=UPI00226A85BB|nr:MULTISPECIES: hypothetical protein [unclassified Sphingomonas]
MIITMLVAAAAEPAAPKTILDGYMTVAGLILLVGLAGSVMTILRALRATRLENEKAMQEREDRFMGQIDRHNDSVEDRLKTVEVKCSDFMPRVEIEKAIDHLKDNRLTVEQGLKDRIDGNSGDIRAMLISIGKLEQKQDGLASDMSEIKLLLKEQARDTGARFDKLQDCVNAIGRKVA